MNRSTAKKIAQHGISWSDIREMMIRAYDAGAADERRGVVNKLLTKAASFNLFWECILGYDPDCTVGGGNLALCAIYCLHEFGEDFWGGWRPETKKRDLPQAFHQEAIDPRLSF